MIAVDRLLGRSPEDLTLPERWSLVGKWIALEIYTPQTLPLRAIAAAGDSAAECTAQLQGRGLDPARFEFTQLSPPY